MATIPPIVAVASVPTGGYVRNLDRTGLPTQLDRWSARSIICSLRGVRADVTLGGVTCVSMG